IFRAHPGWPIIDVTRRAIEETAVIILESLKERDEVAKNARASLIYSCVAQQAAPRTLAAAGLGARRSAAARSHAVL
ncbi:hypothetical protein ABTM27_21145, partial [Acinetobacter baumannii]